jgi:hypothetical protein
MAAEALAPDNMPSQPQSQALRAFMAKKKFLPEKLYPGASTDQDRERFEAIINALASELISIADKPDPKPKLLEAFKTTYPAFEYADTEERERALGYFEELMEILGVESSDGLLNKLLYGFNPQQSSDSRNAEALAAMTQEERAFATKIDSLTAKNAQSFLFEALGKPTVSHGSTFMWLREKEPAYLFSFASEPKTLIIWLVKGRFMYSKQL